MAIPSTVTAATLSFWLRTDTAESGSTAYDTVKVQVVDGSTTTTLATYSNVGANATYAQKSFNVTAYKGKTVTVKFLMSEDSSLQTSFVVDDTAHQHELTPQTGGRSSDTSRPRPPPPCPPASAAPARCRSCGRPWVP